MTVNELWHVIQLQAKQTENKITAAEKKERKTEEAAAKLANPDTKKRKYTKKAISQVPDSM